MLSTQEFVRLFTIENNLIHTQAAGLTTAETLIQPQPTGNCMNWVLGHILESQISMLTLLGAQSPVVAADLERYKRESDPIRGEDAGVLPVERLLEGLDSVHAALVARLPELSDADFVREIVQGERKFTVGWRFLFLHFHYTYHLGQLELLRQLAGHTEKLV
jgi:hypothetical protein